jgi:hypothetical protein
VCQISHKLVQESSKIVPLGAPLFSITYRFSTSVHPLDCSDFCRDLVILNGRRCADNSFSAELFKFLHRSPFLLSRRVNVSHGHLNARIPEDRGQGGKAHVRSRRPRRERVPQVVQSKVALDTCTSGSCPVCFLHATDRCLSVERWRSRFSAEDSAKVLWICPSRPYKDGKRFG